MVAVHGVAADGEVAELLSLAGLHGLQVGPIVATIGPNPCAVEYSACPDGTRRGRLPVNLVFEVLELCVHRQGRRGRRYVGARFTSWYEGPELGAMGWVNLCGEHFDTVMPFVRLLEWPGSSEWRPARAAPY